MKLIDGMREFGAHLALERFKIIGKEETLAIPEMDFALELLAKGQIFPGQFQLAQQPIKGSFSIFRPGVIGNGVQACFQKNPVAEKIRVETAQAGMLFKKENFEGKSCCPDGSGQTGKAAADH